MSTHGSVDFEGRHARARARLTAYAAGLLPEHEERVLLEHAGECGACKGALAELARDPEWEEPGGEHLAPELLARWPQSSSALAGIEREVVARHLEQCPACREELQVLGFEPALAAGAVESVRPISAPAAPHRTEPMPGRPPGGRARVVPLRPRFDRAHWAFGGWATAATAAAGWLLVVHPQPTSLVAERVEPPPVVERLVPERLAASVGLLAREPVTALVQFPLTTRGASAPESPPTIVVPAGQQVLYLAPPPLAIEGPAQAPVIVEIRAPGDSVLCRLDTTLGGLLAARALPFSAGGRGFASGTYALVVRGEALKAYATNGEQRFGFRIEIRR